MSAGVISFFVSKWDASVLLSRQCSVEEVQRRVSRSVGSGHPGRVPTIEQKLAARRADRGVRALAGSDPCRGRQFPPVPAVLSVP